MFVVFVVSIITNAEVANVGVLVEEHAVEIATNEMFPIFHLVRHFTL